MIEVMDNKGWISLHRKIIDDPMYLSEPFTKMQAWIDMLIIANYIDKPFYIRGNKVDAKRGQIGMSKDSLADRWKWSRGKVIRFLECLETDGKIIQHKNNITSLISIVNYNKYQADGTTDGTRLNNINNNNKYNKEKNKNKIIIKDSDVDLIYQAYPAKCPIRGSSTGKTAKNKEKIKTLLKSIPAGILTGKIKQYVEDCSTHKVYLKNFSTFLNNIPDVEDPLPDKKTELTDTGDSDRICEWEVPAIGDHRKQKYSIYLIEKKQYESSGIEVNFLGFVD